MHPIRLDLTYALSQELGLLRGNGVRVVPGEFADDALLETVHDRRLVKTVKRLSEHPEQARGERGIGTEDTPAFPGMHLASALAVGSTVAACRGVWQGECRHAVISAVCTMRWLTGPPASASTTTSRSASVAARPRCAAGGLPRPRRAPRGRRGAHLLGRPAGDDRLDPRERPGPVPGHRVRRGHRRSQGPGHRGQRRLPSGTGDEGWLRAFDAVVPPVVEAFQPDILVTQHGCDCHFSDPLAHLAVSIDGMQTAYSWVHDLAHRVCDGRWVALGGGGYELVQVVPRAWSHLIAIAAHTPVSLIEPTPRDWQQMVLNRLDMVAPPRMGDLGGRHIDYGSFRDGYHPEDPVDIAIMATRRANLPRLGAGRLLRLTDHRTGRTTSGRSDARVGRVTSRSRRRGDWTVPLRHFRNTRFWTYVGPDTGQHRRPCAVMSARFDETGPVHGRGAPGSRDELHDGGGGRCA